MKIFKIVTGFLVLFFLYHAAEYFVLFQYKPWYFLALQMLFLVAAWLVARWQGYRGLSAWGLAIRNGWGKKFMIGMLLGFLLYVMTYLFCLAMGVETLAGSPSVYSAIPGSLLFGFGVFFTSLAEDILTRGYIFRHWNGKRPGILFVFLSATIYLLNHIYRLGDSWDTLVYLFALGILFSIPLLITRSLWMTVGMHWMGNTVFYFTHSILDTQSHEGYLSANIVFIVCILLFIPVVWRVASRVNDRWLRSDVTSRSVAATVSKPDILF